MPEENVFVSLGSNLGDRWGSLRRARALIAALPGTIITGASSARITRAVGLTGQPDFLNQVLRLSSEFPPEALLWELLRVELRLGRRRGLRWGPRTIDLDILFYGFGRRQDPRVRLPHPEVWKRPFFLEMVSQIDPEFLELWRERYPAAPESDA